MPASDTFDVLPIGELIKRHLRKSKISVDPFARNKRWATYTNDLNPETAAEYHMDAYEFLLMLKNKGVQADLVIFDPPYSPRQIKECYDSIGLKMGQLDAMRTNWQPERDLINQILAVGGVVVSCGWNSMGMGQKRPFSQDELLIVCHGVGHNDTLVLVESKQAHQPFLLAETHPTPLALDGGDSPALPGFIKPEDLSGLGAGSTPARHQ